MLIFCIIRWSIVDGQARMEEFLLQLEMNYSTSLINERSYNFFVYPVPNNEKVQSLLLKFGLENSISDVLFIVNNIIFTRYTIYVWKDERKTIIDYKQLYSMEIINSILYLNEIDVSNGRPLLVFEGLGDSFGRMYQAIKEGNHEKLKDRENYVEEILLLFRKSILPTLEKNFKNKQEQDQKQTGNNLFGFLSKESNDVEKLLLGKADQHKSVVLKASKRLSIKPFIQSDFIKDIQDCFELDESQVLLCYDDSFFKSSHIALLITKENLYLRKDVSTLKCVQIPFNLIQNIECKGLLIKKICVTTKNGDKFQQEFDNAEKHELEELPEYLKKILL